MTASQCIYRDSSLLPASTHLEYTIFPIIWPMAASTFFSFKSVYDSYRVPLRFLSTRQLITATKFARKLELDAPHNCYYPLLGLWPENNRSRFCAISCSCSVSIFPLSLSRVCRWADLPVFGEERSFLLSHFLQHHHFYGTNNIHMIILPINIYEVVYHFTLFSVFLRLYHFFSLLSYLTLG